MIKESKNCLPPLIDYIESMANYFSCRCLQGGKWDDFPHTSLKTYIQILILGFLRLLGQLGHTGFLKCPVWMWKVTRPWVFCNASHKKQNYVNKLFYESNHFMLPKPNTEIIHSPCICRGLLVFRLPISGFISIDSCILLVFLFKMKSIKGYLLPKALCHS